MTLWSKIKYQFLKLGKKNDYKKYLDTQLNRSKSKYAHSGKNDLEVQRKERLVALLTQQVALQEMSKGLVIGCRNSYELDLLESQGVRQVMGIDLFSFDPRIKVMDMMELKFDDDTFGLIYCSHALEHAYDYKKALAEIVRVAKDKAIVLIEIPIHYEVRGSDLHDLGSFEEIAKSVGDLVETRVLYGKDIASETEDNLLNTDVARVIMQISKN